MPFWIKAGSVAALIAALVGWHYYDRNKAVQGALEAQRAIHALNLQREVNAAVETSNSLLAGALENLGKRNEEIKSINNRLSALLGSMQQRPRREDSSSAPGNSLSCTGAELFREDGEFLAGEAARADRILKERNYYYEEYRRAREALAAHQKSDAR